MTKYLCIYLSRSWNCHCVFPPEISFNQIKIAKWMEKSTVSRHHLEQKSGAPIKMEYPNLKSAILVSFFVFILFSLFFSGYSNGRTHNLIAHKISVRLSFWLYSVSMKCTRIRRNRFVISDVSVCVWVFLCALWPSATNLPKDEIGWWW